MSRLQALTGAVLPSAAAVATRFSTAPAASTPYSLSGDTEADPVALRLVAQRGERLARLAKLSSSLSDPRFILLPVAVTQLDIFSSTVQVRDVP